MLTDCFKGYLLIGFDDDLIMYVCNDVAAAQRLHGKAQNIAAQRQNNILNEFRTIALKPLPFFRATDAFIGNRFAAKTVFSNPWFDICQASARG